MNIKTEIMKVSTLSELNELSALINHQKTMLGKTTLSVGDKVWMVQKTKKTLLELKRKVGAPKLGFSTRYWRKR